MSIVHKGLARNKIHEHDVCEALLTIWAFKKTLLGSRVASAPQADCYGRRRNITGFVQGI